MIRFIYWFLVLLEVFLLLATLVLFIVTDSRTIRYVIDSTTDISRLSYSHIEGNLFNGLEISDLRYMDKALFSSATLYWNPLTLFYEKVTLTKLEAEGIELDNILEMIHTFSHTKKRSSKVALKYAFAINSSHFELNPFVYEGVKFSSVVLNAGKIDLSQDWHLNTKELYFQFDSDLGDVRLHGEIQESVMLLDFLELKELSSKEIAKFSRRLRANKAVKDHNETQQQDAIMPIKEVRAKEVMATLKAVKYGSIEIQEAKVLLENAQLHPSKNFLYDAEKLDFFGRTNFGNLAYEGYVKDANIHAKGRVNLSEELFRHYKLPLNAKAFTKLPSSLHLNHKGVWIELQEHEIQRLLKLKSDFNIKLSKATHAMSYLYKTEVFHTKSQLEGAMDYADSFVIDNDLEVKEGKLSYEGHVKLSQTKALPRVLQSYLLKELQGSFKGTASQLDVELENEHLTALVTLFEDYEQLEVRAKSKNSDIAFKEFVSGLTEPLLEHRFGFDAKATFDLDTLAQSMIEVRADSDLLSLGAKMQLKEPYQILFSNQLKETSPMRASFENLQLGKVKTLEGSVTWQGSLYAVEIMNENLKLLFNYDSNTQRFDKGTLGLGLQNLTFGTDASGALVLESETKNLQEYFQELSAYYDINLPNLQGDAKVKIRELGEQHYHIKIQSQHLKYLSDDGANLSVTNLYDVNLNFSLKNFSEIKLESYAFKIDDNEYLSSFFATKPSWLELKGKRLELKELWVNDEVLVQGVYDIESLKGLLSLKATPYKFRNKDFDLVSNVDLSVKLEGKKIEVDGDILLLGKAIYYEVAGTGIVEDRDIVIVEEMLAKETSAFKNLKLYLKIKTQKPLVYQSEEVEVSFVSDLSVLKNYGQEMMVTGQSTLNKGVYQFEDKRFVINKSHLYFTGDVNTPLLDIKASYAKDEYNVHVFVSGTTDSPIVNFNAEPFLTQQQIMSLILFDGTGSSTGTGAEAYTILGGTFAKGLIKSLGIDIDHLLLGQNEEQELSLEVGKKISEDISVLYLRKDGLDGVKVRLEHSKHFETDIIIQPPNTSSIEFLYKQDR